MRELNGNNAIDFVFNFNAKLICEIVTRLHISMEHTYTLITNLPLIRNTYETRNKYIYISLNLMIENNSCKQKQKKQKKFDDETCPTEKFFICNAIIIPSQSSLPVHFQSFRTIINRHSERYIYTYT